MQRKSLITIIIVLLLVVVLIILFTGDDTAPSQGLLEEEIATTTPVEGTQQELVTVVAEGLEIPWDIAFLPASTAGGSEGRMLVTERPGRLVIFETDGTKTTIETGLGEEQGEGGLLGVTLHPDFATNQWVYLYMTAPGAGGRTENRVERYRLEGTNLEDREVIIAGIPGAPYHDGGRIEFGPPTACLPVRGTQAGASGQADCLLYITTGDSTQEDLAQDRGSLAGKVLRLEDDGAIPAGNPFGTAVYSYGHRNPQGIAWDNAGRLWSTEHGRSGIRSGLDELNLIERGANYGWPTIEGDESQGGMKTPVSHSGADTTWAPASLVYLNGSLFFGGLRGEALYEAVLEGTQISEFKTHFKGEFGRIRTVRVGPDGMLYLTTSNRDGRGDVREGDDKIIRINPNLLP